ncbi:unnamed protein product, partial [Brassica rapa]
VVVWIVLKIVHVCFKGKTFMVWLKDKFNWDPSDLCLSVSDLYVPWCSSPLVFFLRDLTCMYYVQ